MCSCVHVLRLLHCLLQSLNTQEAYVTSHMKAIVRRDHELLGDRAGDERPFSSVEDAVKRLLPYHIYHEKESPPEQEKKCEWRRVIGMVLERRLGLRRPGGRDGRWNGVRCAAWVYSCDPVIPHRPCASPS